MPNVNFVYKFCFNDTANKLQKWISQIKIIFFDKKFIENISELINTYRRQHVIRMT